MKSIFNALIRRTSYVKSLVRDLESVTAELHNCERVIEMLTDTRDVMGQVIADLRSEIAGLKTENIELLEFRSEPKKDRQE